MYMSISVKQNRLTFAALKDYLLVAKWSNHHLYGSGNNAVKVNNVEMSMQDIVVHTPKATLPLREGSLSLSLDFFRKHSGTVVTIVTPSVKVAISLVRVWPRSALISSALVAGQT